MEERRKWVELLRSAAGRLGQGTGEGASPLEDVLRRLRERPEEVRREVIKSLCREPDELSVEVLSKMSRWEEDWRLRLLMVEAFARAGGGRAMEALKRLARDDPMEEVQIRALQALGESVLRAYPELRTKTREVRVRGAIRVRGIAPSEKVSPEVGDILALLDEIRHRDLSESVRRVADEVLGKLDI